MARSAATGLRLLCAVQLTLSLQNNLRLLRLSPEDGTVLYFGAGADGDDEDESTMLARRTRADREAQSAWLVDQQARRGASVLQLLQTTAPEAYAAALSALGLSAGDPVAVVRLVQECWTSELRDRFFPCTLTLHDPASLDAVAQRLADGRAFFEARGFASSEVCLAHVFVDSAT